MAEKKPEKKKAPSGRFKLYKAGKSASKSCPKCGDGYLMAPHKDRSYCGKCHYTEFGKK